MRLLAVDTATQICSVALIEDGVTQVALSLDTGQTHTRTIMDAIASVLRFAEVEVQTVEAFVVTQGPGSFTGLRIGISTVKGLAAATGKPMIGISTLDVLASQVHAQNKLVCPMLDARRGEVYWMLCRRSNGGLEMVQPAQVGPAAVVIDHIREPVVFIGNGALVYQAEIESRLDSPGQWTSDDASRICPSTVARLGWEKYIGGQADDPVSFAPIYLRRSDAEINLNCKSSS